MALSFNLLVPYSLLEPSGNPAWRGCREIHRERLLPTRAGDRFCQYNMNSVQDGAVIRTLGKIFVRITFFAGAFYEITDFKVESVSKGSLFC